MLCTNALSLILEGSLRQIANTCKQATRKSVHPLECHHCSLKSWLLKMTVLTVDPCLLVCPQSHVHERAEWKQTNTRTPEERGRSHFADHHHLRLHGELGNKWQHRGAALWDCLLLTGRRVWFQGWRNCFYLPHHFFSMLCRIFSSLISKYFCSVAWNTQHLFARCFRYSSLPAFCSLWKVEAKEGTSNT